MIEPQSKLLVIEVYLNLTQKEHQNKARGL